MPSLWFYLFPFGAQRFHIPNAHFGPPTRVAGAACQPAAIRRKGQAADPRLVVLKSGELFSGGKVENLYFAEGTGPTSAHRQLLVVRRDSERPTLRVCPVMIAFSLPVAMSQTVIIPGSGATEGLLLVMSHLPSGEIVAAPSPSC